MTFEEIKNIAELQIEVTPAVEDAFYFLNGIENSVSDINEAQILCGQRLRSVYSEEEAKDAIKKAYMMIDNIKKYGIACAAWA